MFFIRASLVLAMLTMARFVLADSVKTTERKITRLAEGVYEIRHKDAPDGAPQGNTTVIIGEREVLVVDSCGLPSSAREDITQIRQWTGKPVRYLLNTHWHYDHVMGNQAYADAFPSLIIIAQINTQKQLEGYLPWYAEAYRHDVAAAKHMLEAGKDDTGTPLTESARKQLQEGLSGVESVSAEFTTPMSRLPDLTFERELDVNLGNRDVQMKYLGRGNTTGDAIVYLPKENILVAGDLLDCPVPYFFGGYPAEQIVALEKMAKLDATTIVPGHGDVLHDKVYLNQVIALLKTVVSQTQQADYRTAGLISARPEDVQDAVMKAIDLPALRKQFAGDDPDNDAFFASSMAEIVKAAYWQRDY